MTHGEDTDAAVGVIDAGSRSFLECLFGQDGRACAKVVDFVCHDSFLFVLPIGWAKITRGKIAKYGWVGYFFSSKRYSEFCDSELYF